MAQQESRRSRPHVHTWMREERRKRIPPYIALGAEALERC